MSDLLTAAKQWWLQNVTAPQAGDWPEQSSQFFQYRKTGAPGVIRKLEPGVLGRQVNEDPAGFVSDSMAHGLKTDPDTAAGLAQLRGEWASRHAAKPNEGTILVSPQAANSSDVYAHEATHALFNQMGITPAQNKTLGDEAPFVPRNAIEYPPLRATEGAAYSVGQPARDTAEEKFMRDLIGIGRRNGKNEEAAQMEMMYRGPQKKDMM